MKVAVLGGTGLIGWHTVNLLREKGHDIRVLARKMPDAALGIQAHEFTPLDLYAATEEDFSKALEGCTGLVQAAGADPRIVPKGSAHDYFFEANVHANNRLLEAAQKAGVRAVVLLTSYFHPLRPEMADHPYVASRIASEESALSMASEAFRIVILQPPYVFGSVPGRKGLGDSIAKFSWLPLLLPKGGTNAMSVRSLSEGIVGALSRPVQGRFLVGDENLTNKQLFRRFGGRSLGLPTWILRGVMWLGRVFLRLRGRESGLDPVRLVDVLASDMFYDCDESAKALGYTRGHLDEAIADIKA
ncbi:MAG: NAD-dependent epimerase/dehydratase family protein [Myxococcota bacterium]|nr:NAD-dependent epimerase/dehydratase family protein [Myxococcota bacterium]